MPKLAFRLTLTRRVWALAALALATMALGTGVALYRFNAAMLDLRRGELRSEVEIAAAWLKSAIPADARDANPAAAAALERLRPVRFGANGYFFAISLDGDSLLAPTTPEIEGTSLLDVRDGGGGQPFQSMLKMARQDGAGFVTYPWPKHGAKGRREQISYVKSIPELGLLVGAGGYDDDAIARLIDIARAVTFAVSPLLLMFVAVAFFIGRTVSQRLRGLGLGLDAMAQGKFDIVLPGLELDDELGEMARSVEAIKLGLRGAAERQSQERAARREVAERSRKEAMGALAQNFETAVGGVVEGVTAAAGRLENLARALVQEARFSDEQAETGARSAETASQNVISVASAAEELNFSAAEIGASATRSRDLSEQAAQEAEATRARMNDLAGAIDHIGGIVATIAGIAEQTNMLALNATIEAARAGEQGRGFAVVAQEVKSLAEQTSRATSDVAEKIGHIQRASQEASGCISDMAEATREVNAIASNIATSVDLQVEATREIASNVHDVADRTSELAKVIEEVRAASRQSGDSAEQVLDFSDRPRAPDRRPAPRMRFRSSRGCGRPDRTGA